MIMGRCKRCNNFGGKNGRAPNVVEAISNSCQMCGAKIDSKWRSISISDYSYNINIRGGRCGLGCYEVTSAGKYKFLK